MIHSLSLVYLVWLKFRDIWNFLYHLNLLNLLIDQNKIKFYPQKSSYFLIFILYLTQSYYIISKTKENAEVRYIVTEVSYLLWGFFSLSQNLINKLLYHVMKRAILNKLDFSVKV